MRNQGWNITGIGRFREICKLVPEDREKNKVMDARYMEKELDQIHSRAFKVRNGTRKMR
jgi:hypothetical protein